MRPLARDASPGTLRVRQAAGARAGVVLAGVLLASCQSVPPPAALPPAPASAPADLPGRLAPEPGATLLQVDSATSRIELRLAAAGPLSSLGHPHVVVVHALAGEVLLPRDLARTRFELRFAVATMSVDDPAERMAAGGEFAAPIPAAARAGTREHMLGAGQLEAALHPQIVLRAQGLRVLRGDAAAGEGEFDLAVQLLGRSVPLAMPVHWQRTAQGISAQGEFPLLQTALGIEPYSIGGGALRVADAMQVRYTINAR